MVLSHKDNVNILICQYTSCACAAFTAFFNQIPFVHVEAGLRTYDQANPFPEEFFRRIISLASTINFAPTITAKENLIREGITKEKIIVTGNTIVDTIELLRQRASGKISENSVVRQFSSKNIILITCHRRENQDEKFLELIDSIKTLATGNKSVQFVWISHVTPFIRKHLTKEKFKALNNIVLLPPVNVYEMISLYDKTLLIITDSGGIQEEAPSFNIPVILIRNHTERSESVEKGYSKVIGLKKEKIIGAFNELTYQRPSDMVNPYGNGHAAKLILSHLGKCF